MAFNGSGTYLRVHNWVTDRNDGLLIQASRMDEEADDIATALSTCLLKDGQQTPTANFPMGGFKITNLGDATTATDALNRQAADARFQAIDATLTSIALLGTAADKIAYTTGIDIWAETACTAFARTLLDDVDAATMKTTLGLVIGTNVQAYDATLTSIALLGTAADKLAYTTAIDIWAEAALTAYGRSIIAVASEAAFKTLVNLEIGIDVQAYDATLTSIALLGTAADKLAYTTGIDTWAETACTAFARTILDDANLAALYTTIAVDIDTSLTANSDAKIPSQKAAKAYVDTAINTAKVGTITNDNAAVGDIGEFVYSVSTGESSTVTISNASPGVISWAAHGRTAGSIVNFTTTGALPTGLSAGTNYYVCAGPTLLTNSFTVATTAANALAGTGVNTSSAGSGVHTAVCNGIMVTATALNVAAISLTAGDWDIWAAVGFAVGAGATSTLIDGAINSTSATLPTPLINPFTPYYRNKESIAGGTNLAFPTPVGRISIAATTTYYLIVMSSFSGGTLSGLGAISARRAR